jgi:hypothetical protein
MPRPGEELAPASIDVLRQRLDRGLRAARLNHRQHLLVLGENRLEGGLAGLLHCEGILRPQAIAKAMIRLSDVVAEGFSLGVLGPGGERAGVELLGSRHPAFDDAENIVSRGLSG